MLETRYGNIEDCAGCAELSKEVPLIIFDFPFMQCGEAPKLCLSCAQKLLEELHKCLNP